MFTKVMTPAYTDNKVASTKKDTKVKSNAKLQNEVPNSRE